MSDPALWVQNHLKAVAAIVIGLGVAGFLLAGQCAPRVVETTKASSVSTVSAHSAATTTKKAARTTTRKVREVTTRPDGTKVERVEESTTRSDSEGRREESAQVDAKTEAKTETKRAPAARALGVNLGAEWSRLTPIPTSLRLGADVPIGSVLGSSLRLGAEVRADTLKTSRGDPRAIEAAGVYVRGEFF